MKQAIQFPMTVKQIAPNVVEFETKVMDGPFFAQDAIDRLAPELSEIDKVELAEKILQFALNEAIRRSIQVVPVFKRTEKPDPNAKYAVVV